MSASVRSSAAPSAARAALEGGDGPLVIVGAGIAGVQAAGAARKAGFPGPIALLGSEAAAPYDRPSLSKRVLQEPGAEAKIALRPEGFFADNTIDWLCGASVTTIDRERRRVRLSDGKEIAYGALILCPGSAPRPLKGLEPRAPDVFYLRDLEDSLALRARLAAGARLAIVGGGIIGLEVAAAAVKAGAEVTIIEAAPRLLTRAASPTLAAFFEETHRSRGVDIRLATTIDEAEHGAAGWRFALSDGSTVEADLALVAIGVAARSDLAAAARLSCGPLGIAADGFGATADPYVFAAGEAAFAWNAFTGRAERQENWFHAAAHGEHVGRSLFFEGEPYAGLAGYWTDQYDIHLQTAGEPIGDTDVSRRLGEGKFVIYHLRDGVLVGASAVSAPPRELRQAKGLVRAHARLEPAALADPAVDLAKAAA